MSIDYPSADVIPCPRCGNDATRASEGLETDWYECKTCATKSGVTWDAESSKEPGPLVLQLKLTKLIGRVNQHLPFEISIKNTSERPITIMRVGDGSSMKWRPPYTELVIREANGTVVPLERPHGRCGMMNPLTEHDFLQLKPGESHKITGWFSYPMLTHVGKYFLQALYENNPISRYPTRLGESKPGFLDKMRSTYECKLLSNLVQIEILD